MPWRLCDEITHGHQAMGKPVVDSTVPSAPNALQWRHNEHDGVSNHWSLDWLLKRLIGRRTKNKIKAPLDWPLWGESTGDRWIPLTKKHIMQHISQFDQAMVERDRGCDNISKVDGFGGCHSYILQWWSTIAYPNGRLSVRLHFIEKKLSRKFYPAARNFTNRMLFCDTHIFKTIPLLSKRYPSGFLIFEI